jgi:putative two-component system response regulator
VISEEKILNARILVIDDNVLNVQILKKILTEAGFHQITSTTDSTQALNLFQEVRPDLILLDLNMPKIDGFKVMEMFTAIDPKDYLPVLVLTAEEEETHRTKALQSGAKDFLKKPYDRLEVILRSRNIIEVRLLYKQLKDQNKGLEERVESITFELRETRLDVIYRLARVAEYRDATTGAHIMRMSRYCKVMAKAAGLTPPQCELILNTSPLHDIGKVAIPDSILCKRGKLKPQEYEIMKTHTTIGSQILNGGNSAFLKMAQTIAITHHEKYNGLGYPHGLKGDNIPLVGRICSICDAFDALTSQRSYKEASKMDAALEVIIKDKGSHFDPRLVDAFIDVKKEIKEIYDQYQ